jgi:hypothetical protein
MADQRLIPDAVLDLPVTGVRLTAATLREAAGARVTLLVFLRHFG